MERRVLKKTAVEVCASCKKAEQEGCVRDSLLQSPDGRITIPLCMTEQLSTVRIGQKSIFEFCQAKANQPETTQKWSGHFETKPDLKKREKPVPKLQTVEITDAPFKNWDEGYTKILHCIKDHYTIAKIAKQLNLPRSTVVDRLAKLEQKEIITKTDAVILGVRQKTFIITSGWAMKLVNNGEAQVVVSKPFKPEPVKFTRHAVTLQAEILEGTIPKGDRSYTPNGWTGEIFEGNGTYKIRVIPNRKGIGRAAIDINLSLGASSVADLNMKYHGFAEKFLGEWAEKHNIKLGQITEYKTPHTPVEGSRGLAQTIMNATGGETKFVNMGVQVDKSDKEHKGEVEFHGKEGEQSLRNFEFALNQAPEKMEQLVSQFDNLSQNLHKEVEKVGSSISGIQVWLILQRENDLLREQIQLLREQMDELKKQNTELKSTMGLAPASQSQVQNKSKWDDVGIYG